LLLGALRHKILIGVIPKMPGLPAEGRG